MGYNLFHFTPNRPQRRANKRIPGSFGAVDCATALLKSASLDRPVGTETARCRMWTPGKDTCVDAPAPTPVPERASERKQIILPPPEAADSGDFRQWNTPRALPPHWHWLALVPTWVPALACGCLAGVDTLSERVSVDPVLHRPQYQAFSEPRYQALFLRPVSRHVLDPVH